MRALVILLLFLALLGGAGFYNYDRNEHLDKDLQLRPYKGLSDTDLASLIEAYQQQISGMVASHAAEGGPRDSIGRAAPSDLAGKLEAFEEFQQENVRWRERHRAVLGEQVTLDKLRLERAIRDAGLDQEWRRILRRLITL
jgi:hypothetical protein